MTASDCNKNVQSYKIYQAMFRVIKESENVDERQHCFLVQTAGQESRYFSMETRQDLLKVESAWHRAVCQTVSQMGVSDESLLKTCMSSMLYTNRAKMIYLPLNEFHAILHNSSASSIIFLKIENH